MKRLDDALRRGFLPHAMLFCGGNEQTRTEAAESAAKLILCMDEESKRPCGVCQSCSLFAADSHPDYIELEPPDGKKSIPVDDIRALISKLSRRPVFKTHVVYIKEAHTMLPSAQNALLKTLEEPPEDTVIMLGGSTSGLLPTVLSRCMKLSLPPEDAFLPDGEAKNVVDALYKGGSPLSAADFYSSFNKAGGSAQSARMALDKTLELQADYFLKLAVKDSARTGQCLWSAIALVEAKKKLLQNANIALTVDTLLIDLEDALKYTKGRK